MASARRLGIHAPYAWDLATQLACSLGELAQACGLDASYLANQRETGVCDRWDARVLSEKTQDFQAWIASCKRVVWFSPSKAKVEQSRRAGRHNSLVLLWDRVSEAEAADLSVFDCVVCPSSAVYQAAYRRKLHPTLVEIPWDCGSMIVDNPEPASSRRKLLAIVDGAAARRDVSSVFASLRVFLDACPDADLTLCHGRAWSRATSSHLQDLLLSGPGRVSIKRKADRAWRAWAYSTHHWMLLPNVLAGCGFYAAESLAANCPVIAHDTPPVAELVRSGHNGHLVRCPWLPGPLGEPRAAFNARAWLRGLEEALADPNYAASMRRKAWPERQWRRRQFVSSWKKLWELA